METLEILVCFTILMVVFSQLPFTIQSFQFLYMRYKNRNNRDYVNSAYNDEDEDDAENDEDDSRCCKPPCANCGCS